MTSESLTNTFEVRTPKGKESRKAKQSQWGDYEPLPRLKHPYVDHNSGELGQRIVLCLTDRYEKFIGVDGQPVGLEVEIIFLVTAQDAEVLIKRGAVRIATEADRREYHENGRVRLDNHAPIYPTTEQIHSNNHN